MAAIVCQGLGKLCTLPCRVISAVCGIGCDGIGKLCSGPFCLYNISTLALNIPPIAVGAKAISKVGDDCKGATWLLADMCFCVTNIAAAWYISSKLQNREDPQLQGRTTTFSRAIHILCYDPIMAVYLLLLIAFFCCICVGTSWTVSGKMYEGGNCDDDIGSQFHTAIGCGFAFFSVGFMTLSCSLCIAGCDGRRYSNNAAYNETNNTQQETTTQQTNYQDVENFIPVATPVENTAKPSSASYSSTAVPSKVVEPEPSAPPLPSEETRSNGIGDAKSVGEKFGKKIGKLLSVDEGKQAALGNTGAKAGAAVGNGLSAVKKFAGLKTAK